MTSVMGIPFQLTFDIGQAQSAISSMVGTARNSLNAIQAMSSSVIRGISSDFAQFSNAMTSVSGSIDYVVQGFKKFQAFEKMIIKTGALVNATKTQLQLLADTAMQLGAETEHKATDVATAMSQMALAGFSVNEIIGAMPGLLGMATAGMIGIGQATTISSEILRTFQIEAKNMDYVAGALTTTFTTTNTTLGTLSYTMKYVGSQATELGVGLSQVAAVAGILGNLGIKGSMSGTGLRQFIEKLSAGLGGMSQKLSAGAKGLTSMGITWKDISDEAGNLDIVLAVGKIGSALDKMGAKATQRLKILRDIFGTRASSQVAALISGGPEIIAAKDMEIAFGGAKQQLMGLIQQATKLPEGMQGIKINAQEIAESFVTVGGVGRRNLARLGEQMRDLGLVGGLFNTQLGLTRDRIQKVNGKLIKDSTFTPLSELTEGTLRAVDGLTRLRNRINSIGGESAKLKVLTDLFGADPKTLERATKAFMEGGSAMKEFANNMLRANSAMDIQKKIMDSSWGSLELLEGSLDTYGMALGELVTPIIRVAALFGASMSDLLMAGNTIEAKMAEFKTNLGGLETHINKTVEAFNKLSVAGKAFAIVVSGLTAGVIALSGAIGAVTFALAALVAFISVFIVLPMIAGTLVLGAIGMVTTAIGVFIAGPVAAIGAAFTAFVGFIGSVLTAAATFYLGLAGISAVLSVVTAAVMGLGYGLYLLFDKFGYLAYVLFPVFIEGLNQAYDAIMSVGTMSITPTISLSKLRDFLPEGGVQATVIKLKTMASEGMADIEHMFNKGIKAAFNALYVMSTVITQVAAAVAIDAVENFGETVAETFRSIATIAMNQMLRVADLAEFMSNTIMRAAITQAFLFVEGSFYLLIGSIKGAFGVLFSAAKLFVLDLPVIFLNGFLRLQAITLRFLGNVLAGSITVFSKVLTLVIDSGVAVLDTVAKITLVFLTLPVSLPYIAVKAAIAFMKAFMERLQPGFDAIRTALVETFNKVKDTLIALVENILNAIVLPIKLAIMSVGRAILGIGATLLALPSLIYSTVGKVVDFVLDGIDSIGSAIYEFMIRLPVHIRRFIIHVFDVLGSTFASIVRSLTSFGVSIVSTISRIMSGVGQAIVGAVLGLPYMILRVGWAVVSGLMYGIIAFMQRAFRVVTSSFLQITSEFIFRGVGRFVRNFISFFQNSIPAMVQAVRDEIANIFLTITDAIFGLIYGFPKKIVEFLQWVVDDVLLYMITVPVRVGNFIVDLIDDLVEFVTRIVDSILTFGVDEVGENVVDRISSLVNKVIQLIIDFPAAFLAEIDAQIIRVQRKLSEALDKMTSIDWKKVGNAMVAILANIFDRMKAAWASVMRMFTGEASGGFITLGFRLLSAIGTMFTELYNNFPWDRLRGLYNDVVNYFSNLFEEMDEALMKGIGKMLSYFSGGKLLEAMRNVIVGFLDMETGILGWVVNAKEKVTNLLGDDGAPGMLKSVIVGVLNLVEAGARITLGLMQPIIAWLERVFAEVQDIINMFSGLWATFDLLGAGIGDIFTDPVLFARLKSTVIDALDRLMTLVPEPFKKLANTILTILGIPLAVGASASGGIATVIGNLLLTFLKIMNIFAEEFEAITELLLNNTGGIVDWFKDLFEKMSGANSVGGMAAIVLDEVWKVFYKYSNGALNWVVNIFKRIEDELRDSGPIGEKIADLMKWVRTDGKKSFQDALDWVKATTQGVIEDVKRYLRDLEVTVKSLFGMGGAAAVGKVEEQTKNATGVTGVKGFIEQKLQGWVIDPINKVLGKLNIQGRLDTAFNSLKGWGQSKLNEFAEEAGYRLGEAMRNILEKAILAIPGGRKILNTMGFYKNQFTNQIGNFSNSQKAADMVKHESIMRGVHFEEAQNVMGRLGRRGIALTQSPEVIYSDLADELNALRESSSGFDDFKTKVPELVDEFTNRKLEEMKNERDYKKQIAEQDKARDEAAQESVRILSAMSQQLMGGGQGDMINISIAGNGVTTDDAQTAAGVVQQTQDFSRRMNPAVTPNKKPFGTGFGANPTHVPARRTVPRK